MAGGAAQPALDQSFGYDAAGRLTTITTAAASWTISYDANGNRRGVTLNGAASTYTTEPTSNRLASTTNLARSFSYDQAGNTTASTAVNPYTATYDLAGRMAALTKSAVTTTYSIDGSGRRVRKFSSTGAGSTVIFVYDQAGQILGEYDSTGKAIREYVWMGTTPVAVLTPDPAAPAGNPIVYTIHADHLGAPRVVLDKNGAIRWRWMAEPFGTAAPETNPSGLGAFTLNLRFPGQYADQESGLFYNNFRDYDPSVGRYVESDPIGLAGGINTYTYVSGSPLDSWDFEGLAGGRGERGAIGGVGGQNSANPYKHCRELNPPDPKVVECKHHQTGKWIRKPRPPEMPFPGAKAQACLPPALAFSSPGTSEFPEALTNRQLGKIAIGAGVVAAGVACTGTGVCAAAVTATGALAVAK